MKFSVFIGVDVSKDWLDFAVFSQGELVLKLRQANSHKGLAAFSATLKKQLKSRSTAKWLFCMEHTGLYCNPLLKYAADRQLALWLEDALVIKSFHGLARGKDDALDACRIAEYAWVKSHQVKLWEAPRPIITQLNSLLKLRRRLLLSKKKLQDAFKEEDAFTNNADWKKMHKKLVQPAIIRLNLQIREVEKHLQELLKTDKQLREVYRLMKTVSGVGDIVALNFLVATNEFKKISEPKKMACHCGVAPFTYRSGKSIRGRAKVSHRANKHMKSLLHLAAMAAINSKGELRNYYLRKVEEGKNKMAVLNAVRNKIIHRLFAVVRQGQEYNKFNIPSLA
jgi:transposase